MPAVYANMIGLML